MSLAMEEDHAVQRTVYLHAALVEQHAANAPSSSQLLKSLKDVADHCEPSEVVDPAPVQWSSLPDGVKSLSCEAQAIAEPLPADSQSLHWVYRFNPAKLPVNSHGLARISVLLRGAEKTGMLAYTHSVALGLRDGQQALLLDAAESPEGAEDLRVLEFPHFPAERPLFFGAPEELRRLEVHVHLLCVPPPTCGRDMIKVVGDAVFAPYVADATVSMALERPDGLPSRVPTATLLKMAGTLRVQGGQALATERRERARIETAAEEQCWPSLSYGISTQLGRLGLAEGKSAVTAARAWGAEAATTEPRRPLWVEEIERCADILPTLYTVTSV